MIHEKSKGLVPGIDAFWLLPSACMEKPGPIHAKLLLLNSISKFSFFRKTSPLTERPKPEGPTLGARILWSLDAAAGSVSLDYVTLHIPTYPYISSCYISVYIPFVWLLGPSLSEAPEALGPDEAMESEVQEDSDKAPEAKWSKGCF